MIDILTNGFLTNPIPIQYTGNWCSHACSYCFSNLNNPFRKANIQAVVSQLKNHQNRNDFVSYFLREKYPLLISNNIDPFSKSNQPFVNDFILQLKDMGIPVVLATRGGVGWEEIIKEIEKTVFYVSIPYDTEEKRQKFEPKAPELSERWQLVKEAKKLGHEVVISINPLNESFAESHLSIAEKAKKFGVESLLINKLHLSPKQRANLSQHQKEAISEKTLTEAQSKKYSSEWLNVAKELFNFCKESDMNLLGFDSGLENDHFKEWRRTYKKLLPTKHDFFNWCAQNKKEGDLIYFEEFYNFFAPKIPDIDGNISKYVFNKSISVEKNSYKRQDMKNLLHYYWQVKGVSLGLAEHYPAFSWAMKNYQSKQDFVYDSDHNKVLFYHSENFNPKSYITVD